MIYTVVEIFENKEIVLYESQNELSALKYMNRSIAEYTERLMFHCHDINEANAIIAAESRYRLCFFKSN